MTLDAQKMAAAQAALDYVEEDSVIGVGTGSTADFFIHALASKKHLIKGAVASSKMTASKLKDHGIPVFDLNSISALPLYVDGADQINSILQLIKGGGGALTREKIIAAAAETFICIADSTKMDNVFGSFPLPVEVIPMARSYVARKIVELGGNPVFRDDFVTDNGNIILDIYHLNILEPMQLEEKLNNITGVVCNGLFACRSADVVLLGTETGVKTLNV